MSLSFQISADDIHQFVSGVMLFSGVRLIGIEHVHKNMPLDDLRHQTVQAAPARGHVLQNSRAILLFLKGAFDAFNLSPNAADAVEQFFLITDGVHD